MYYYAAIGGYDQRGKSEWLFLTDTTFTVFKTGDYMLELYGKGREAWYNYSYYQASSGGAFCQHYDTISLEKGEIVQIVIGSSSKPETKFGEYSVSNGENGKSGSGGNGTGNRGANGSYSNTIPWPPQSIGTGLFSSKYGMGGTVNLSNGIYETKAGPRAVYLKYLGI